MRIDVPHLFLVAPEVDRVPTVPKSSTNKLLLRRVNISTELANKSSVVNICPSAAHVPHPFPILIAFLEVVLLKERNGKSRPNRPGKIRIRRNRLVKTSQSSFSIEGKASVLSFIAKSVSPSRLIKERQNQSSLSRTERYKASSSLSCRGTQKKSFPVLIGTSVSSCPCWVGLRKMKVKSIRGMNPKGESRQLASQSYDSDRIGVEETEALQSDLLPPLLLRATYFALPDLRKLMPLSQLLFLDL
ncbi:hypothetical protein STAS_15600 [Striga asiatica]|uniref:Uncharacterized protein n=1 Tax=Striga asiatica TaxID=4170 RepID=A0A5A7Q3V3_STRAF|nr:hypothetical protein STAS_15600 [Striga asiatica]